jgi:hypothetical protein
MIVAMLSEIIVAGTLLQLPALHVCGEQLKTMDIQRMV